MLKFVSGINLQEGYKPIDEQVYELRIEREAREQKHYLFYKEALKNQALVKAIAEEIMTVYKNALEN